MDWVTQGFPYVEKSEQWHKQAEAFLFKLKLSKESLESFQIPFWLMPTVKYYYLENLKLNILHAI